MDGTLELATKFKHIGAVVPHTLDAVTHNIPAVKLLAKFTTRTLVPFPDTMVVLAGIVH